VALEAPERHDLWKLAISIFDSYSVTSHRGEYSSKAV